MRIFASNKFAKLLTRKYVHKIPQLMRVSLNSAVCVMK